MSISSDLDRHPQAIAFLQAVIEQPDDDLPRLAFADWLEENGDSNRAEFIRLQIEKEKLPEYEPRRLALEEREAVLRKGLPLNQRLIDIASAIEYRRGFVEHIKVGVRRFLDHAAELFSLAPIQSVHLTRINQTDVTMPDLAANPYLARVRGLCLRGSSIGDHWLADLLNARSWDNLEELDLTEAGAGNMLLEALAAARLPRLRILRLARNPLYGGLHWMTSRAPCFSLTTLDLSNAILGQEDIQALAGWPGLASLQWLDLSGSRVGVRGMQTLTRTPHLGPLKHLDLHGCQIGIGGAKALAECTALADLVSLRLGSNAIKLAGLKAILASSHMSRLEGLYLSDNALGDEGITALAAWHKLKRQKVLRLGGNHLSEAGVKALVESPHLGHPFELSLRENTIGTPGVRLLAGCPRLDQLHTLDLDMCRLDTGSADALLASPNLGNLRELSVQFTGLRSEYKRLALHFHHVTI
jgi:uncharacterized protein (TIGR02996 family)